MDDTERSLNLAEDVVRLAKKHGADDADVLVAAGTEFEVTVRQGQIDRLIEAGSKALGLRVFVGGRPAISYTSDFARTVLDQLAQDTVERAAITDSDPAAGLPDADEWRTQFEGDLMLDDPALSDVPNDTKIEMARRCEAASFGFDPRITRSDGATCSTEVGVRALVNSRGFGGGYRTSGASLQIEVMADDEDGKKRNDHWYSVERFFDRLEPPEEVGRKAAERALTHLGARKVPTRAVPVVWENQLAQRLVGIIARAASGEALHRRQTFLMDLEGEPVASALVTIIDDPLIPGRLGSRPFDGEGVTSRRNELCVGGIFSGFLFDTYTARKTGRRTTGSAVRGIAGAPSVGTSNLFMEAGTASFEEIIASVEDGLFLTDLMGFGVNITTGDFSQGAAGRWIEHGKLSYPVTEINISGNLQEMLRGIEMIGSDLFFRGSAGAPTLRMARLMVSGL
ncbi:MAG: TldD/PmbA family protein [Chloroflexi bacterium]|nr:TldD/PmbA family protein [Chloroflexota bacterium]